MGGVYVSVVLRVPSRTNSRLVAYAVDQVTDSRTLVSVRKDERQQRRAEGSKIRSLMTAQERAEECDSRPMRAKN